MRMVPVFVAIGVLLLAVPAASAQTLATQRPYRGLFAGGATGAQQGLTFSGSLGAGYNHREALYEPLATGDAGPATLTKTTSQNAFAGLAYGVSQGPFDFSASAGSSGSYYSGRQQPVVFRHRADVDGNLHFEPTSRTRINAGFTGSYYPIYILTALPALAEQVFSSASNDLLEADATVHHFFSWSGSAGLEQKLTERAELSFTYAYNDGASPFGAANTTYRSASGRLRVAVAKGLGVHLGYTRRDGTYQGGTSDSHHVNLDSIDGGVDFRRALSISRRMTLAFGSGLTGVSEYGRKQYRLIGNVRLNREIGRSWNANLRYTRDVQVLVSFNRPVVWDSVTVGLGGLLSRRTQLNFRAAASSGNVGLNQSGGAFRNLLGGAAFSVAMTRLVALKVDYAYSRYEFGENVQLASGLLREVRRHSVRANLNLWLPLLDRSRRPNASR